MDMPQKRSRQAKSQIFQRSSDNPVSGSVTIGWVKVLVIEDRLDLDYETPKVNEDMTPKNPQKIIRLSR